MVSQTPKSPGKRLFSEAIDPLPCCYYIIMLIITWWMTNISCVVTNSQWSHGLLFIIAYSVRLLPYQLFDFPQPLMNETFKSEKLSAITRSRQWWKHTPYTSNKYPVNKIRSGGVSCGSINTGHQLCCLRLQTDSSKEKALIFSFIFLHMHIRLFEIQITQTIQGGEYPCFIPFYPYLNWCFNATMKASPSAVCSPEDPSESKSWWRIWFYDVSFLILKAVNDPVLSLPLLAASSRDSAAVLIGIRTKDGPHPHYVFIIDHWYRWLQDGRLMPRIDLLDQCNCI